MALVISCSTVFSGTVWAAPETFADVPMQHWSYHAVQELAKEGIISGDAGRFNGDRTVTRYEMAVMIANGMTKMAKADAQQKAMLEKLAAEYDNDLKQIGARLVKVEAQAARAEAKAKVNFFFDNRLEYTHNSLDSNNNTGAWATNGKVKDKDQFMERIRIYMNVPVGDQWDWNARFVQAKWSFNSTSDTATATSNNGTARFDRFWLTGKNMFGGTVEMGKMQLYPGKGAFFGNTGDTEGLYYTRQKGKLTVRSGVARSSYLVASGQMINFGEVTYRPTKTMDIGAYVLRQNYNNGIKDLNLFVVNGAAEVIPGGLALSFEYAKNRADDIASLRFKGKQSGYFIALQSKYAATNYNPSLYTNMVNPFKQGDSGWGISYRHMPSGVAGYVNRGAFSWIPLTTDSAGSWQNTFDGINAWRFDYVYVPWKNVQWTLTYDRIKPINGNWTNNSIQSTFNFFF
ncbi:MAG: S-layer homology domain-containing protein [Sporomusaceae bacterium]|nr:S-layer homology domain-containing protein [Sporomusaceae bacterium]